MDKIEINIRNSINTDTINEDYKQFTDSTAPLIENTGIERDGGLTNIYEKESVYSEDGQYLITEDNKVISVMNKTSNDLYGSL